jgi:hypothetical protein
MTKIASMTPPVPRGVADSKTDKSPKRDHS